MKEATQMQRTVVVTEMLSGAHMLQQHKPYS